MRLFRVFLNSLSTVYKNNNKLIRPGIFGGNDLFDLKAARNKNVIKKDYFCPCIDRVNYKLGSSPILTSFLVVYNRERIQLSHHEKREKTENKNGRRARSFEK